MPVSPLPEPLSGRATVRIVAPVVKPKCDTSIRSVSPDTSLKFSVTLVTVYVVPARVSVVPEPPCGVADMY